MLVFRMPNLLSIDGIPVSNEERTKAELYFIEQLMSTPRKFALLPCGHLAFGSAVTAQNGEFRPVLIARIHAR